LVSQFVRGRTHKQTRMEVQGSNVEMTKLQALLAELEAETGSGSTSCVTFGLPAASAMQGPGMIRQEEASAAKIQSCL